MKMINGEFVLPGPSCVNQEDALAWLSKYSQDPFAPGALAGHRIIDPSSPNVTVSIEDVILTLAGDVFGDAILVVGDSLIPLVSKECAVVIAGMIENADDLVEMLDVLSGIEDHDLSTKFTADIANSVVGIAEIAIHDYATDEGNPYHELAKMVVERLDARRAPTESAAE